jgi:hypothetical protein
MAAHHDPLGRRERALLEEHRVGDADLADVMEQSRLVDDQQLRAGEAQLPRDHARRGGDAARVAGGVRVPRVDRRRQRLEGGRRALDHRAMGFLERDVLLADHLARLLQPQHRALREVDEEERREREPGEGQAVRPEAGDRHGHQREDELDRHVLGIQQACLAGRQAAAQVEHRQQQKAVRDHEDEGGTGACRRLAAERRREADRVADRPRGNARDHVVRDVEGLDVPGVAVLEPVGQALDDHEQDHQLGRQQQRAGDDEEDPRVEDAPAVEVERQELRG